jgi:hypothetical protein
MNELQMMPLNRHSQVSSVSTTPPTAVANPFSRPAPDPRSPKDSSAKAFLTLPTPGPLPLRPSSSLLALNDTLEIPNYKEWRDHDQTQDEINGIAGQVWMWHEDKTNRHPCETRIPCISVHNETFNRNQ